MMDKILQAVDQRVQQGEGTQEALTNVANDLGINLDAKGAMRLADAYEANRGMRMREGQEEKMEGPEIKIEIEGMTENGIDLKKVGEIAKKLKEAIKPKETNKYENMKNIKQPIDKEMAKEKIKIMEEKLNLFKKAIGICEGNPCGSKKKGK